MRYLGIDYGTKRVGVALSDEEGKVAFPRGVMENNSTLVQSVADLARKGEVKAIVIGESKDLEGRDNPLMEHIRVFVRELELLSGIAVLFEPEFMTSLEARRSPHGEEKPTARKTANQKKKDVDASAAALILQSYLNKLARP